MTDDKDAEELTQGYFQKFGGFTCSWENVQQIISEMLESEKTLKEKLKGFESGEVCWQGDMDATIKQNLDLKEKVVSLANINIKAHDIIAELKKENAELKLQFEKTNEDYAKEILYAIGIVSQRNLKIEELEKENEELKKRCSDYAMQLKRFMKDEELSFMNCNPRSRLEILEENEELKEKIADLAAEWNKERDELKAHCKAVDEVNEKMKCCQNCNHNGKPEDFEHCLNCDRPCVSPNDEIIKDAWELAE